MPGNKNKNNSASQAKTKKSVTKVLVTTRAPAAIGTKKAFKAPNVQFSSDGNCTVTHYEYMFDVDGGAGAGFVQDVMINPQNGSAFTWLSSLATRFEMYKFQKLVFHYKPSTGTNTNGYVVIGFDFDPYDNSSPGKIEMMAWKYSAKSAPWQECRVNVTSDARTAIARYCDGTNPQASTTRGDLRFDYLGRLIVRSVSDSTLSLGEMFVEYTVQFKQPSYKIPPALYLSVDNENPVSPATNLFNASSEYKGNLLTKVVDSDTLRIMQNGSYLINFMTNPTSGLSGGLATNITNPSGFPSSAGTLTNFFSANDTAANRAMRLDRLDVTTAPMDINFGGITGVNPKAWVDISTFDGKTTL